MLCWVGSGRSPRRDQGRGRPHPVSEVTLTNEQTTSSVDRPTSAASTVPSVDPAIRETILRTRRDRARSCRIVICSTYDGVGPITENHRPVAAPLLKRQCLNRTLSTARAPSCRRRPRGLPDYDRAGRSFFGRWTVQPAQIRATRRCFARGGTRRCKTTRSTRAHHRHHNRPSPIQRSSARRRQGAGAHLRRRDGADRPGVHRRSIGTNTSTAQPFSRPRRMGAATTTSTERCQLLAAYVLRVKEREARHGYMWGAASAGHRRDKTFFWFSTEDYHKFDAQRSLILRCAAQRRLPGDTASGRRSSILRIR